MYVCVCVCVCVFVLFSFLSSNKIEFRTYCMVLVGGRAISNNICTRPKQYFICFAQTKRIIIAFSCLTMMGKYVAIYTGMWWPPRLCQYWWPASRSLWYQYRGMAWNSIFSIIIILSIPRTSIIWGWCCHIILIIKRGGCYSNYNSNTTQKTWFKKAQC